MSSSSTASKGYAEIKFYTRAARGRFYLFNLVLYPQDLIYLTLLLIISALALFFVTTYRSPQQ